MKAKDNILSLLQENARISTKDLAFSTGLTEKDVQTEMKKLEESQTIVKYTAVVNGEKVKPAKIRAWIELSVHPIEKSGYNALAQRIRNHKHIVDMYLVSGNYDFLVMVEGESLQEISDFVSDIACVEHVTKTATHVVLNTYKQVGVEIGQIANKDRIAVMP